MWLGYLGPEYLFPVSSVSKVHPEIFRFGPQIVWVVEYKLAVLYMISTQGPCILQTLIRVSYWILDISGQNEEDRLLGT